MSLSKSSTISLCIIFLSVYKVVQPVTIYIVSITKCTNHQLWDTELLLHKILHNNIMKNGAQLTK